MLQWHNNDATMTWRTESGQPGLAAWCGSACASCSMWRTWHFQKFRCISAIPPKYVYSPAALFQTQRMKNKKYIPNNICPPTRKKEHKNSGVIIRKCVRGFEWIKNSNFLILSTFFSTKGFFGCIHQTIWPYLRVKRSICQLLSACQPNPVIISREKISAKKK